MIRVFKLSVYTFLVLMFALPIAGIVQHARAVNQAEREFEATIQYHRREMDRIIHESHVRERR